MVSQKINEGNIANLKCANKSCGKLFSDNDIKNLKLAPDLQQKYEKLSLENAIANMDDMGWCPIAGCSQLANIEKKSNYGQCTFCDFKFCLDCKDRYHPQKRCAIHRVDLMKDFNDSQAIR